MFNLQFLSLQGKQSLNPPVLSLMYCLVLSMILF